MKFEQICTEVYANPLLEFEKSDASKIWNAALDEAIKSVRLETACKDHSCTGCEGGCCMPVTRVHKESILDLKIN